MSRVVSPLLFALAVICFSLYTSLPSAATSVTVTGAAALGNSAIDELGVKAGIFSAFSAGPDGPSIIGSIVAGVPTDILFGVEAFSGSGVATVHVGNTFTDILAGGITFTGTITVPESALMTGSFSAPVDMLGQLMAYQNLTPGEGGFTTGPLIASLLFHGTGTATFSVEDIGDGFLIRFASVDFSGRGTLVVVPEPASLLLVSTGLGLLGIVRKRRQAGASTS
jgi:hypothetical protein